MTLVLGFRVKRSNSIASRLIKLFAGQPTHVLLGDMDRQVWWHSEYPDGVGPVKYDPLLEPNFEFYAVPEYVSAEDVMRWCYRQSSAGYDWFSIPFYWTPLTWRTRWTCSEFAVAALGAGGEDAWINDVAGTPRQLYRAIKKHGYAQVSVPPSRLMKNA